MVGFYFQQQTPLILQPGRIHIFLLMGSFKRLSRISSLKVSVHSSFFLHIPFSLDSTTLLDRGRIIRFYQNINLGHSSYVLFGLQRRSVKNFKKISKRWGLD